MSETPFDSSIAKLEKHIKEREKVLADLKKERAVYLCPFEEGEEITLDNGKRFIITAIIPCNAFSPGFKLRGHKLKINGEQYANESLLYSFDFEQSLAKAREEQ